MPAYIAKKGFVNYLKHKKWKTNDFLEPILAVPLAYIVLRLIADGITPFSILLVLAGIAYITVVFRLFKVN